MGEKSKTSGEIGEKLTTELFNLIGWKNTIDNISIDCVNKKQHENAETHGIDKLFIYNSPFNENTTDVIYVSVKNKSNGYQKQQGFRTELKKHLSEENRIIECAKLNQSINIKIKDYPKKSRIVHKGLLVWLHNDKENLELDIRDYLSGIQLSSDHKTPITLIDVSRASFIYNCITNFKSKSLGNYYFYYPKLGNATTPSNERFGTILPLELIASDIIPIKYNIGQKPAICIYIREEFSKENLKKAYALALDFCDAWVNEIQIGFSNYSPTQEAEKSEALMAFPDRSKIVRVFSYKSNLLSLLGESNG